MHRYCLSFVSWMILHFLWIFKFCENWIFQNCNFNRSAHINLSLLTFNCTLYRIPSRNLFVDMKNNKKCNNLKLLVDSLKRKKIQIFGIVNSFYERNSSFTLIFHAKSISHLTIMWKKNQLIFLDIKRNAWCIFWRQYQIIDVNHFWVLNQNQLKV